MPVKDPPFTMGIEKEYLLVDRTNPGAGILKRMASLVRPHDIHRKGPRMRDGALTMPPDRIDNSADPASP